MQPTIEILDRIRKNSRDNKEEIFTRLYRYLLRPDQYYRKGHIHPRQSVAHVGTPESNGPKPPCNLRKHHQEE